MSWRDGRSWFAEGQHQRGRQYRERQAEPLHGVTQVPFGRQRVGEDAEVARIAERLAAELDEAPEGFLVLRKTGPTPAGFPRRTGVARKRPLA